MTTPLFLGRENKIRANMNLICMKYKYLKVMFFHFLKTALETFLTVEIIPTHCRKFWGKKYRKAQKRE